MTVDIYRAGHSCNMCRQSLNVESDCCRLSAKSLRSDAQLVDLLQHLFLKICIEWIGLEESSGLMRAFLRQKRTLVKCTADADAHYHRRTRIRACCLYSLDDEILIPEDLLTV